MASSTSCTLSAVAESLVTSVMWFAGKFSLKWSVVCRHNPPTTAPATCNFYPAIRSIGRDTKLTVTFFIHSVRLRISQLGPYRSAWNFTWWFDHISDSRSSPILGDSHRDGRVFGVNRGHMEYGICFLLKHLWEILRDIISSVVSQYDRIFYL